MAVADRISDPSKIPVQINVKVPYDFRAYLYTVADKEGISLSALGADALWERYGPQFTNHQAPAPK